MLDVQNCLIKGSIGKASDSEKLNYLEESKKLAFEAKITKPRKLVLLMDGDLGLKNRILFWLKL